MEEHNIQVLKKFVGAQIACWNARDKEGFFSLYRQIAPELVIEHVGKPLGDPWQALEEMWRDHNATIQVDILAMLPNGNEVACHNSNKVIGTDMAMDTIEIYKLAAQTLTARFFTGR